MDVKYLNFILELLFFKESRIIILMFGYLHRQNELCASVEIVFNRSYFDAKRRENTSISK